MITRSLRNEIICDYKDICRDYDCNSRTSHCPYCKKNKYKPVKETKNSYYEPKNDWITNLVIF